MRSISIKGILIAVGIGLIITALINLVLKRDSHVTELSDLLITDTKQDEIEKIFDGRAKSLVKKDEKKFLSLIDESNKEFYEVQRKLFDDFKGIPFSDVEIIVDTNDGEGYEIEQESKDELFVVSTVTNFWLKDVDSKMGAISHYYTLRKVEGDWKIHSDVTAEMLPGYSPKGILAIGKLESTASERFLVLFHPGNEDLASRLITSSETAMTSIAEEKLKREMPKTKIPLLLCSNCEEANRVFEGVTFPEWAAGYAIPPELGEKGWILFNQEKVPMGSVDASVLCGLVGPLIAHMAVVRIVPAYAPYFYIDGLAGYIGGREEYGVIKNALQQGIPLEIDLDDLCQSYEDIGPAIKDEKTAAIVKEESYMLVKYMVDKYGYDKMLSMIDTMRDQDFSEATNKKERIKKVNACFKRTFGVGWEQFKKDWMEYVRSS